MESFPSRASTSTDSISTSPRLSNNIFKIAECLYGFKFFTIITTFFREWSSTTLAVDQHLQVKFSVPHSLPLIPKCFFLPILCCMYVFSIFQKMGNFFYQQEYNFQMSLTWVNKAAKAEGLQNLLTDNHFNTL